MPNTIDSEQQLDAVLAAPSPDVVEMLRRLPGDIMILGIGGKMGYTTGCQAVEAVRRSGQARRVYGVSRFSDPQSRRRLDAAGVETIACDLIDPRAVNALPDAPNVLFMAGRKFGTGGQEAVTWAMNTIAPANAAARYRHSRMVAFSTGNVYPFVDADSGGCDEDHPTGPVGEYAQSCLGRERIFEYFSRTFRTPVCIYRLNYACELRYGVLHDIGTSVWNEQPIDPGVGFVNVIWQGDAVSAALLCLQRCASPPDIMNVTGTETVAVRSIAEQFADLMGRSARFDGQESRRALLSDARKAEQLFGPPSVSVRQMIAWNAHWIMSGGRSLDKPTHFQEQTGRY